MIRILPINLAKKETVKSIECNVSFLYKTLKKE